MKILVLGGTRFLTAELARQAVVAGDDVTCAARGESGRVPDGARHVVVDRSDPATLDQLAGESFDAVVDPGRRPTWVRQALDRLDAPGTRWTFISSCSVYRDEATPGQDVSGPLRDPAPADSDEGDLALYGELKVSCEQAVLRAVADRAFVCRPGLVVGPHDLSGRFGYWVERLADGGPTLAPGSPDDPAQVIDVRDLAAWLLACVHERRAGVLDAISMPVPIGELLADVARGVGNPAPDLVWRSHEMLAAAGVEPWMGPRSLPLWLPQPEYAGFMAHDTSASVAAGMPVRPFDETARDTLAWLRATPDAVRTGLTRAEEAEVLAVAAG